MIVRHAPAPCTVVHRTGVNGERCHLAREGLVDRGPIRFADVAICPRRDVGLDTVRVTWPAALGLNHLAVDVEDDLCAG